MNHIRMLNYYMKLFNSQNGVDQYIENVCAHGAYILLLN